MKAKFIAYPEAILAIKRIFTNHNAPNYKLFVTDKKTPAFKNWKTLIAESEMVMQDYVVTKKTSWFVIKRTFKAGLPFILLVAKKFVNWKCLKTGNDAVDGMTGRRLGLFNTHTPLPQQLKFLLRRLLILNGNCFTRGTFLLI